MAAKDLLDRLSDFLDEDSPGLTNVLCSMWKDQQNAITYRELREAILDGSLSIDYLDQWRQDYSAFVADHYAPMVQDAVESAAKSLLEEYGGKLEDPQIGLMDDYIRENGSKLIREISEKQYLAINTLVRQATLTGSLTVDQLARAIRPCIGLTQRQAATASEMYKQLREEGLSHKKALEAEIKYASKQQRYRAAAIAQTEMAFAYNNGCDAVVRQNVEAGNVGEDTTKEWSTARDERVCKICGSMHGETIPLDGVFSNGSPVPPGHTCCRCTLKYHLTRPGQQSTNFTQTSDAQTASAPSGALDPESVEANKHAELYYEEVRNRKPYADARHIAEHTDFTQEEIEEIRRHVFIDKHELDEGFARFAPDYEQAQAWQRLVSGKNIKESDIVLLKHEQLELTVMRDRGYNYDRAHDIANGQFNWWAMIENERGES